MKKKEKSKKSAHYVDNEKLLTEINIYVDEYNKFKEGKIKEKPKVSEYIGSCILLIAERLANRPNFSGYCVDAKTEILSKRGWLKHNQISKEDIVLSYDIKTKNLVWSKINNIFEYDYNGKMHKLDCRGIDALVTPNHKFITQRGLTPVEQIRAKDSVYLTGNFLQNIKTNNYSDEFIKLIGWFSTEGTWRLGKNKHAICIFQNEGGKAEEIRNILQILGCKYKEYCRRKNMIYWSISGDIVNKEIINICPGKAKAISTDFINSLDNNQRMILIETMVKGDGWTRKGGNWSYCQKDEKNLDAFITLCTLSGLITSKVLRKHISFGKPTATFGINIFAKKLNKGENINFHGGKNIKRGVITSSSINVPTQDYKGKVWCVETDYGSFMCRRGKYNYLTGNSYRDEFVGDAVENCLRYLHNFDSKKSSNPFSYFSQIAWYAFVRRLLREKEEQYTKAKIFQDSDKLGYLKKWIAKNKTIDDSTHDNPYAEFVGLSPLDVANFEAQEKATHKNQKVKNKIKIKNKKVKKSSLDDFFE